MPRIIIAEALPRLRGLKFFLSDDLAVRMNKIAEALPRLRGLKFVTFAFCAMREQELQRHCPA